FRTGSDYLRFGESLRSPLFSVWYSVWDGLYSTLWGDSYCAGTTVLDFRPPWSYDFMVAGMSLALVPTAAILLGSGVAIFWFLRKPTIVWTFLLAVAFLVALFLIYGAMMLPCYGSVKAFYGLPASVPLCALAALGFDLLCGHWRWLRGLIFIVLGVWALNVAATYWISPVAAETKRYMAKLFIVQGNVAEAISKLEQLLREYPDDTLTRILLARAFLKKNLNSLARQVLELPLGQRDLSSRHFLLGFLLNKERRMREALYELQVAMELAPNDGDVVYAYAAVACAGPDVQAAIEACRNVLRVNPYSAECHAVLSKLYIRAGDPQSAYQHQAYLQSLKKYLRQIEKPEDF
ncbi:MAG TPA: tetratricopeptide repeat protein, partial [Thermoguttaceae bacterium]